MHSIAEVEVDWDIHMQCYFAWKVCHVIVRGKLELQWQVVLNCGSYSHFLHEEPL